MHTTKGDTHKACQIRGEYRSGRDYTKRESEIFFYYPKEEREQKSILSAYSLIWFNRRPEDIGVLIKCYPLTIHDKPVLY